MKNGIKNKIVTCVYDLKYIDNRGSGTYKGFDILTLTIRNLIFPDYDYVIYTNQETLERHNLNGVFNQPNVKIKIHELNSDFYLNKINPLRLEKISEGHIWDRIHSVDNYVEVMYNKLNFLSFESIGFDGNVLWIDSGLFGTSCANAWRDYMVEVAHTENFLDKVFEKINQHGFIALKGDGIFSNYQEKEYINNEFNTNLILIAGGLFGGKSKLVLENLIGWESYVSKLIDNYKFYTSDQEILWLLLNNKENVHFFEFGDWDDLQKSFLKILDLYNVETYDKNSCLSIPYVKPENVNLEGKSFTEVADFYGIDKGSLFENHRYTEVYEVYLKNLVNKPLNMVEIGINDSRFPGKCIDFWTTVFSDIKYYGYDISDCSHFRVDKEKVFIYQGDQNDSLVLETFVNNFSLNQNIDVVIDDGSHVSEHIITSFKFLFEKIKEGGFYSIEGLHAPQAERDKTVNEIKYYLESNNIKYNHFSLHANDKLLLIQK